MSNILSKDSSKVIYTQKLIVSKKFDNLAKITLRVTETGPSRIHTMSQCCRPSEDFERIFSKCFTIFGCGRQFVMLSGLLEQTFVNRS